MVTVRRGPKTREKPNGAFIPLSSELVAAGELDGKDWSHLAEDEEAFFAPMPMRRQPEKPMPRAEDAAFQGPVLWADVDGGLNDAAREWLTNRMGACLVRSGGITKDGKPRYHVYIRLIGPAGVHKIETLNKGLIKKIDQLNGFRKSADAKWSRASVLRVPGTVNRKHRDECPMGCTGGHDFSDVAE
ncbi:hypothetical protein ACOKM5_25195 [Streptomyces sp. BH097]|uniref:hypothetical protein n=1 Tax=Streptomyces sp. BH097 TaxID=3410406 RepID=UPI003CE71DB6